MNDPSLAASPLAALPSEPFPPTSRYHGIPVATLTTSAGKTVIYLRRRFVPQPERFATLQIHGVGEGERPDHIAHHYLGDALQFWRLCDANRVLNPPELTAETGQQVRITLPEGIPGTPDG